MKKRYKFFYLLIFLIIYALSLKIVDKKAMAITPLPDGFLDGVQCNYTYGWTKDPDYNGSISVHFYIDGKFVGNVLADQQRDPVGKHGFSWNPPILGDTLDHEFRAYAIGVDASGKADGKNFELNGSPKIINCAEEYLLTSSDGKVKIAIDAKFGGSITKIVDDDNKPGATLINGDHPGAMMQPAFWIEPIRNYVPENCPTTSDMYSDNPTLGGSYADGSTGGRYGNPIGIMGGDGTTPDLNEFINYENNNQTVHFKSRFVRNDYCTNPQMPMTDRNLWDTNFYLEQWAYFHPLYQRTLAIKNKLIHVGTVNTGMTTRQLPIIFSYLPRLAYYQNNNKIIETNQVNINPDKNWAALIANDKEMGIGMAISPTTTYFRFNDGSIEGMFSGGATLLFPSSHGVPQLSTMGTVKDVFINNGGRTWSFAPNGTFEWYTYFPIGSLDMIKSVSETLLNDPQNFGFTPGDLNNDQKVNIFDLRHFLSNFLHPLTIFDYNKLVENFGK